MASGSAITSRDSQEVRHIAAARQARSGCPRWKKDAPRPATSSANAIAAGSAVEAVGDGARISSNCSHSAL